jgi:CO/xanthine dehydrogenase FAD-binding subunit
MQIRDYVRAGSLDEAMELLLSKKTNRILGGCTFFNMTNLRINTAIDLQDLSLDYIREEGDVIAIGAYTSLREIETSELIRKAYGTMFKDVLMHLIGVQLRNTITIGGHVASRFGFSDIIPTLISLDASVVFYKAGEIKLEVYMKEEKPLRDILTEIRIPNDGRRGMVQMMRTSFNDYSLFCLAMTRKDNDYRVAAGVLPGRAKMATEAMAKMAAEPVYKEDADKWAKQIVSCFTFGSNTRAAAAYRQELCSVFARRGIEALADGR